VVAEWNGHRDHRTDLQHGNGHRLRKTCAAVFHSIIVSPTATDEGISSIGPYVFQANSTNGAKGKTMAQYAVNVIGAKSIAILGSASASVIRTG
jgi:hypothetical protein